MGVVFVSSNFGSCQEGRALDVAKVGFWTGFYALVILCVGTFLVAEFVLHLGWWDKLVAFSQIGLMSYVNLLVGKYQVNKMTHVGAW